MIGELDIKRVGFIAGTLSSCFVEPAMQPDMQLSHLVVATSGRCLIDWMLASFHDEAPLGCSCKKYRPAQICFRYTFATNLRWTRPIASRLATSSTGIS